MGLHELRLLEVNYQYIEELFGEFCKDKFSDAIRIKIMPFANLIAMKLYRKMPNPFDNDYEVFFSASITAAINCLRRKDPKDFENHKAFYAYMNTSTWFDARNILLTDRNGETKEPNGYNFDTSGFSQETRPSDIRDTLNFSIAKGCLTKTYLALSSLYADGEKACLRGFYYDFLANKDRDAKVINVAEEGQIPKYKTVIPSPPYSKYCETFNLPILRVKELEKISKIIFKMSLMHNMNEDFSIKKFPISNREGKSYYDKFFLTLACLDRYPYLMELLSTLGTDKFYEVLKIFGGINISIPKISELKKVSKEVDTYLNYIDINDLEIIKGEVKNDKDVTVGAVTSAKTRINNKLNSVLSDAYTK